MKNEKQLSFPSPFGVISISIIQRRLDAITAMGFRPLSGLSLFQFLSAKTSTVAGRSFRPLSGLSLFQYRVYGGRKYGCVMFPSPFGVISISMHCVKAGSTLIMFPSPFGVISISIVFPLLIEQCKLLFPSPFGVISISIIIQ